MPADSGTAQEPRAAVTERIEALFRSFQDGDIAGIDRCLAVGVTVWDVFVPGLVAGRAELERFHARDRDQAMARGPLTMRLSDMRIDVRDGVAWARYLLHFCYQPPQPMAGTVRVTDVLTMERGGWLIAHHHEGLMPEGLLAPSGG